MNSRPKSAQSVQQRIRDNAYRARERERGRASAMSQSSAGSRFRSRSPRRVTVSRSRSVLVKNVPMHYDVPEVKALFQNMVGGIQTAKMVYDSSNPDNHQGRALILFNNHDAATYAIETMNGFRIDGRCLQLQLCPDTDPKLQNKSNKKKNKCETFGLSTTFLESLNIQFPLRKSIFVSNLVPGITEFKLERVFKLAGKILNIQVMTPNPTKHSALIEYNHPVEAVQAISMFNGQIFYDRQLDVKMNRSKKLLEMSAIPGGIPNGLQDMGPGLGENGAPLRNVSKLMIEALHMKKQLNSQPNSNNMQLNSNNMQLNSNNMQLNSNNMQPNSNNSLAFSSPSMLNDSNTSFVNPSIAAGLTNQIQQIVQQTLNASLINNIIGQSVNMSSNNLNQLQMTPFAGRTPGTSNHSHNTSIQQCAVVVARLPNNIAMMAIQEMFGKVGNVATIEKINPSTAIVNYADSFAAERAIKLFDQTRIQGNNISVKYY